MTDQTEPTGPKLSPEQQAEVKASLVSRDQATIVRFLYNGQALNITSGELCAKGTNVIYHPVYWNFDEALIDKIVDWLGVTAVKDKA